MLDGKEKVKICHCIYINILPHISRPFLNFLKIIFLAVDFLKMRYFELTLRAVYCKIYTIIYKPLGGLEKADETGL